MRNPVTNKYYIHNGSILCKWQSNNLMVWNNTIQCFRIGYKALYFTNQGTDWSADCLGFYLMTCFEHKNTFAFFVIPLYLDVTDSRNPSLWMTRPCLSHIVDNMTLVSAHHVLMTMLIVAAMSLNKTTYFWAYSTEVCMLSIMHNHVYISVWMTSH